MSNSHCCGIYMHSEYIYNLFLQCCNMKWEMVSLRNIIWNGQQSWLYLLSKVQEWKLGQLGLNFLSSFSYFLQREKLMPNFNFWMMKFTKTPITILPKHQLQFCQMFFFVSLQVVNNCLALSSYCFLLVYQVRKNLRGLRENIKHKIRALVATSVV